ncbi:hypothetical protein, conserved [Leishmania tarentolae]|uniref:Uncharacterized protein n=1 Tax=Leishmania tarentolae TaxID=5689 RepID=A0A640L1I4_LEITA|nr:hypothetical protein, conserved [Leishmania tarentolae]
MQEETSAASLTAAVPAGRIVARLSATLQQTEQECAELSSIEKLLSSLSSGATELIRASATSVGTGTAKPSQLERDTDEPGEVVHQFLEATDERSKYESRVWRSRCSTEVSNIFHSSGLSTSFSALERKVSDAVVLALPSKLQRITEKVKQLCAILNERAQLARQKQVLPRARAQWTCEAVCALHQIAHASLEPEFTVDASLSLAEPCAPLPSTHPEAGNSERSCGRPASNDAVWFALHAGLHRALHQTVPCSAISALGKSEEVAEGRLELQRRRFLALLKEMNI